MTEQNTDFDELTKRADEMKRTEDQRDLQHEIAGVDTGRNSRFITEAANSQKSLSEKRRAQQMADNDAFYIALMQDGAFGGFVASEVFDGKSDVEIADIVTEIETKTGLSLEDYAADIIGVEASTRRTGESDADYKRRIIKAVAEEMVDPMTGQIKAQYADDPLADIIARDGTYQAIMNDVAHINLTGHWVAQTPKRKVPRNSYCVWRLCISLTNFNCSMTFGASIQAVFRPITALLSE